jgi:hypothetical protein
VLQLQSHFVGDGLDLALVGAGADDEVVGEGSDAGEIEDLDIGSFLGFSGADGNEPGRGGGFGSGGLFTVCLSQNTLLKVSYYNLAAGESWAPTGVVVR